MGQMHPIHEEKQHAEQTKRACVRHAQYPGQAAGRPACGHSVVCVSLCPGDNVRRYNSSHRFRSGAETYLDDAKMAAENPQVALGLFITVQAGSPVPNSNATTVNGQNTVKRAGAT